MVWSFHQAVAERLFDLWGQLMLDLFAARLNEASYLQLSGTRPIGSSARCIPTPTGQCEFLHLSLIQSPLKGTQPSVRDPRPSHDNTVPSLATHQVVCRPSVTPD